MDVFNSRIHQWYSIFKRDLPWRNTSDPYFIWLSEIILQQTRIEQGLAYYLKFTETFPTITDLANASEDQVLKLWQGLGYYSRARNLHFTARHISKHYNGEFPQQHHLILSLKGVGEYTAAAIASIAFNQAYPAIDGNVFRLLSRYFGISDPIDSNTGKKTFRALAGELIKGTNPGMHNQALMEFGALQCTPQKPDCSQCPLREKCYALATKKITELPVKLNKTKQRDRYFTYLFLTQAENTWLKRRTQKDIWENLFEFPMIETLSAASVESLFLMPEVTHLFSPDQATIEKIDDWKIHVLTHQRINYRIIKINLLPDHVMPSDLIRVNKEDIFNFAVPKLLETYLTDIFETG